MTVPLLILSVFAYGAGFALLLGWDGVFTFMGSEHTAGQTLQWIVGGWDRPNVGIHWLEELFTNWKTYVTIVLVFVAVAIAYLMYVKRSINPGKFSRDGQSWLYRTVSNRYYFPEIYNQFSWKLGYDVARGVAFIDRQIIDGSVNGLSNAG